MSAPESLQATPSLQATVSSQSECSSIDGDHPDDVGIVDSPRGRSLLWFAATTLLGAFLVFQVQPIISKCVLPWFGGTPAVWTTCMLFFQVLLFGGYLYAHVLRTWCSPVWQAVIHLTLLCVAALMVPIEPSGAWKPSGTESPTFYLLLMLARHVGLPYFVLSSTGPLIQAWLSLQDSSERVYRLYALSNAGSLFALLSYPFLFEPVLSVSDQSTLWSMLFLGFVLIQGYVAASLLRMRSRGPSREANAVKSDIPSSPVTRLQMGVWVALPALASVMLLVVTNHVCQDIAVVPFLWVLPLSLYLASFIVCFDSPQWYRPKPIAAVTLAALALIQGKAMLPGSIQLIAEASCYMVMLFGACLLCHGEVARLKPSTNHLTLYYALLSAGGALGGIIVAIVCPLLLNNHAELPFFVALVTALTFLLFFACRGWRRPDYDWAAASRLKYGALLVMVTPIITMAFVSKHRTIASQRNFFGVLTVREKPIGICLVHGSTLHGMQRHEPHQSQPTTYYGYESGVGHVIEAMQQERPALEIAVVGLGCGVLTTYGRPNDRFDLIEINPAVIEIADRHFTFMRDCPSQLERHLGDGRLVLERLTDKRFDLLVLDAFSSDAIPAHLLTRESMRLYKQRLADEGVLVIHTSNNHLELSPLVHRLGDDAGLESRMFEGIGDDSIGTTHSTWMILARQGHSIFQAPGLAGATSASAEQLRHAPLWTDQHHDLVSVLRLWQ
ncbi:fused MFS/spermidine synthase [Roseiconus lacunae]|uniref:Fused MFS/spermidine synthase n=1 Tax=Roseiconus lacunae TaxID=2605694 RepID=A0ABT7PJD1_9BACT|nr:fused MFS/spermidine synthase [Roseiconus lacunae]MDM4016291.1 fused MFS/spermidine synthase [Roseiconus lacunae]